MRPSTYIIPIFIACALPFSPLYGADRNGYTAKYEVKPSLPDCRNPNSHGPIKYINNAQDWKDINSPRYTVFCVRPGNYQSAGRILLRARGTAQRKRYIVLNRGGATRTHPIKLNPRDQAIVHQLTLKNAQHWVIHGLTVSGFTWANEIRDRSSDNVLNYVVFDGKSMRPSNGILHFRFGSQRNVVQNSVLRECQTKGGVDTPAIRLYSGAHYSRIVNNEIYNCTDQIVTVGSRIDGVRIENNDVYLTNARYTDGRGRRTQNGPYACAENGIDIKAASYSSEVSKRTVILNNRIWGFRPGDRRCDGSGASAGNAIVIHFNGDNVILMNNIVHDNGNGLSFSNRGADKVHVQGNLFSRTKSNAPGKNFGLAIFAERTVSSNFVKNTIVDAKIHVWGGSRNTFKCNVIVNGGESRGRWGPQQNSGSNAYYGNAAPSEPNSTYAPSPWQSGNSPRCFYRKLLTRPERVCIAHAQTTARSPHRNKSCPAPLIDANSLR